MSRRDTYRSLLISCLLLALVRAGAQMTAPQGTHSSADAPAHGEPSPTGQAQLSGQPHRIVFTWSEVPNAFGYGIQIDHYLRGAWSSDQGGTIFRQGVKETTFTYDFFGDGPGAWRVWAMDRQLHPGRASPWAVFTFGPSGQPAPPPPSYGAAPPDKLAPVRGLLPSGPLPKSPVFDIQTREACSWPVLSGSGPGIILPRTISAPDPE